MTREEIHTRCLQLPEAERVALIETLTDSLTAAERLKALREHLEALEAERMEALRRKLEAEMAGWFDGEAVEWTEADWKALLRGEYKHPPDPNSPAVPPGWKSPRLHPPD